MTKVSAMQRTLLKLREDGWLAEKVERPWNQFSKVRSDLFGFIDVLAIRQEWTAGIQVTQGTSGEVAGHLNKIRDNQETLRRALLWLAGGYRTLEIWFWAKRNNRVRGARKVWTVNVIPVTRELLENADATR